MSFDRLMKTIRPSLPGAVDPAIIQELFFVCQQFFKRSEVWQETFQVSLPPQENTVNLTPVAGRVERLMGVYVGSRSVRGVAMPSPGIVVIPASGVQSDYAVTVVMTVTDPTDAAGGGAGFPIAPLELIDRYSEELMHGVLSRMFAQPAKPYTNLQMASYYETKFRSGISRARNDARTYFLAGAQAWSYPSGIGGVVVGGGGGDRGPEGPKGLDGVDGKSAYQVALDMGFEGSLADWMESLNGQSAYQLALENGYTGTEYQWLDSLKGAHGDNGSSAYEIAVDAGFVGTELEWLTFMRGRSAYQIAVENGFVGTEVQWLDSIKFKNAEEVVNVGVDRYGVLRPLVDWVGDGLYDATYDILDARTKPGYTGDDAPAFNAVMATKRGVQITPEVGYLMAVTSLLVPLSNTKLLIQGGGQAVPIFRHPTLLTSTMIVGEPDGAGAASCEIIVPWFVHTDRLGWYNGVRDEGTALPNRLTGDQAHLEVHGCQSGIVKIGGYGARDMLAVFGGNALEYHVDSYGGMWDPAYPLVQEARSVIRLTKSARHGHGTNHVAPNPQLVGGNGSGLKIEGGVVTVLKRDVPSGTVVVQATQRLGPLFGWLIESCENYSILGGFSGGFAHSNIAIRPVVGGNIFNGHIDGHDGDESNHAAIYAARDVAEANCPQTLMVENCRFNGQLIGQRAVDISGDNGLFSMKNFRFMNNITRAHLGGAVRLTGVDGGRVSKNRIQGYNCSGNDTGAGGDASTSGLFRGGITRDVLADDNLYGGGINDTYEGHGLDSNHITANGTQWGNIDGTAGGVNSHRFERAKNFGQPGGGVLLADPASLDSGF